MPDWTANRAWYTALENTDFHDKLVINVQALDTMGKLVEVNGYVRLILDKLPGIRADLVRMDDDWQEWKFSPIGGNT